MINDKVFSKDNYNKIIIDVEKYIKEFCIKFNIDKKKITIKENYPHKQENLPFSSSAIYMFYYPDMNKFLKIGKASHNTCYRYRHYEYKPNVHKSSLAISLINDKYFKEKYCLSKDNIKEWILNNLQRINIIIDKSLDVFTLNLLETYLQFIYKPSYEGQQSQNPNFKKAKN